MDMYSYPVEDRAERYGYDFPKEFFDRPRQQHHPVLGSWTYRSFVNNPDVAKDFNDLELGRGTLTISHFSPRHFAGRLSFGDTYEFRLRGVVDLTPPCTIRFTGLGDSTDARNQIYDYVAFFVPNWSNGMDQRPALVGSTVRTVPHNGGKAKAGLVATFIALRTDEVGT